MNAALPRQELGAAAGSRIAFEVVHVAVAVGIVGAALYGPANDATLALDRFLGSSVLDGHGIATHLGRESLSAGAPSGAVGWLGAAVAAGIARGGSALVTFVGVLVALGVFALVEARARRLGGAVFGLAATALAAACAFGSLGFAGGIVSAGFAVVLAEIMDRPGMRSALLATLLAVLWCNVAPQGLFAPVLAFVFAAGARLDARSNASDDDESHWRWIAVAGTGLAVLATPGFLAYPGIALEQLRLDRALQGIVPMDPSDLAPIAYRYAFPLVMFAAFAFGLPRKRTGDVLLFLAVGLLALANGSYLAIFGVLVAPLLAASAAAAFPQADRAASSARGDGLVAIASALVAAAGVATLAVHDAPVAPAYGLAAALAREAQPHRLFCLNVDWCDAALANGSVTRVFMDGRVGAYPEDVRAAQLDVVKMRAHWRRTLDAERIDALLARKDRQLAMLIALSPGWRAVASDGIAVLYERAPRPSGGAR